MLLRRLALLFTLTSCTRSAATAPATPPPAPPANHVTTAAPSAVTATPVTPPDACEAALAAHRAALAPFAGRDLAFREEIETFDRCLPTPRGRWVIGLDALAMADVTADDPGHPAGTWSVAHVDASGHTVRSPREVSWQYFDSTRLTHASLADYDGDGEPELVLSTLRHGAESPDRPWGAVLTFRDGVITPYAPAAGIEPVEARDVDSDGRPDLITTQPYETTGEDSPSGFSYEMKGPPLVARSLPDGGFSRDDEVTRGFVRSACPSRVAAVFGASLGSMDEAQRAVVCARLWGVPAAAVVRAIRQRCAAVAEVESGSPRRPHCGDVRVLERWAGLPPPLQMR